MALKVSFATPEDVETIAALHLAAFDSNPLLHVQFPTPPALAALKTILCNDMLRSVQDGQGSGKVILVARDPAAGNSIISFAKWDLPGLGKDVRALEFFLRKQYWAFSFSLFTFKLLGYLVKFLAIFNLLYWVISNAKISIIGGSSSRSLVASRL